MESHNGVSNGVSNGISNGVNGTTEVSDVAQTTAIEVKSVESVLAKSESIDEVTPPAIVEEAVTPSVVPEVEQSTTQEPSSIAVASPQVEEVATLSVEVTETPAVVETIQEVTATPAVVEIPQEEPVQPAVVETPQEAPVTIAVEKTQQEVSAPQPQVIAQEPETTAAPTISADVPVTRLPGSQTGTSEFVVPTYAIDALNRIAQDEGFTNYAISYDRGSNLGDGFVAEIVRAKIKGSQLVKGVQEDSELVLVLKLPPENKIRREQMGMNVFEREVTVYNEILPMFQKFQLDKGLKPGQGFVSFPKCYYASYDKEKDEAVVIMEDIRKKGFKMLNKYKTLDYPHAQAVLETVAQFHGLSLAVKDQCPAIFEKFKGLKDAMTDGMMTDLMKTMTKASCEKAIGTLEPHEENIKQKLLAFGDNVVDIIKSCTNGELSEPYTVINHGDCWTNNIMFKYERGSPRHLCLLDWQISRYASPVLDICYFLFQCTDSELRAQHFDNLVQGYHIALRKQVELLGSDVNQILPFTALLREMKNKAKFALSTALFVIPMMCTANEELPDMNEMVETMVKGEVSEDGGMFQMTSNTEVLYKKRMGGIVRDMYKKGYL
ncbi:uncharacterized oxidoreductase dhs-27-like [Bradysia coprophila]|uniref:uncharacterized oxidoreductase dhs-27-like n=1 Tax=Bradysia coprophila TaxID=38358 RepID=UPI00187DBFD5|nr:uncharacterized oxidoreductase dhs-27-like [Bradysia coprophila]